CGRWAVLSATSAAGLDRSDVW
nr:immunoglobulin heavy chain junction region [Macaca mulatta]